MPKLLWSVALLSVALSVAPNVASGQTFEPGVDRPGADFSNFDIPGRGPHTCQSACFQNGGCRAWTYVRAGFQGPVARCWLKSDVPGHKAIPAAYQAYCRDKRGAELILGQRPRITGLR